MRTTKQRHQFYLPEALSAKLDALAARPGTSKTAILTDALAAWFERAGAAELDTRFGPRFDRLTRVQARAEDKLDTLTEMLGTFVQHQLTLVAQQPRFDDTTQRLGAARYQTFLGLVAQRVAKRTSASRE